MDRKTFLQSLGLGTLMAGAAGLSALEKIADRSGRTDRMPVLFLGHGSPMNAIEENDFVRGFREIAKSIPKPTAILCISAHWFVDGTKVTSMDKPRTIHDFGGFPRRCSICNTRRPEIPLWPNRFRPSRTPRSRQISTGASITAPGRCYAGCTPRRIYRSFSSVSIAPRHRPCTMHSGKPCGCYGAEAS